MSFNQDKGKDKSLDKNLDQKQRQQQPLQPGKGSDSLKRDQAGMKKDQHGGQGIGGKKDMNK